MCLIALCPGAILVSSGLCDQHQLDFMAVKLEY